MTDRDQAMEKANQLAACPDSYREDHVGCQFCAGTGLIVDPEPIADALLEARAEGVEECKSCVHCKRGVPMAPPPNAEGWHNYHNHSGMFSCSDWKRRTRAAELRAQIQGAR